MSLSASYIRRPIGTSCPNRKVFDFLPEIAFFLKLPPPSGLYVTTDRLKTQFNVLMFTEGKKPMLMRLSLVSIRRHIFSPTGPNHCGACAYPACFVRYRTNDRYLPSSIPILLWKHRDRQRIAARKQQLSQSFPYPSKQQSVPQQSPLILS